MSFRFAQGKFIFPEKKKNTTYCREKLQSKQLGNGKELAANFRNEIFLFCQIVKIWHSPPFGNLIKEHNGSL